MESELDHTISEGEGENENKSTPDHDSCSSNSSVPLIVPLNEFRCLDYSAIYLIDASNTNPLPEVPPPTPQPNVEEAAQNVGGVDENAPPTPFYVNDDSLGRTLDLLWMMERTSGSILNQKNLPNQVEMLLMEWIWT
ncbi:hypothetical protein SESBI_32895 [Sesbania bispinosa]|nr:hypothetical protein SESBI_32895 [Sesbania bispinosa]